jgi:hypothetical protein
LLALVCCEEGILGGVGPKHSWGIAALACKPLRLIHPPSPPPKQQQDAFKVPLVIQLTDDEKFLWRCGAA